MARLLKRIGIGILLFVIVAAAVFASLVIIDARSGRSSTELTNVTYPGQDGTTLRGYLAEAEGPGPHPG